MRDFTQYGHFDESVGAFILTAEPPRKWWNLHCSAINPEGWEMYAECAHVNDGPVWVRNADGLTVNLVPYDAKYHYVRDDESGTVFCAPGMPTAEPVANRVIEFHREKTIMRSECVGLRVTQRVFVPQNEPVECTTLTIENLSDRPRRLSVFAYAAMKLNGTDAEGRALRGETFAAVHPEIGGVLVTNRWTTLPTADFKGFHLTLNDFFGGATYRDDFTRADYNLGVPRALFGWDCENRASYGADCAGIVQVKLEIEPHGVARADFVIGQTTSLEAVRERRTTWSPERLDAWCEEARQVEAVDAGAFSVDVGHPLYNGLFNIFLKKQLKNYLINKSGFRDNLQADMALALANYPIAEANFLRALASQFPTGSVPHGFRPLNRLQYSDKPAWIPQVLASLVMESGDFDLLEKRVPFFESNEIGTVWEHALRAVRFLAGDTGRHGLCDQHHADWNDGLEATSEAGARESVFVTMQLCLGLREMAELAGLIGDRTVEEEMRDLHRVFVDRINDVAWDGEWYVRTLCEDGYRIGSKECEYGRFFLNTQSWAVLSGVADEARGRAIMSKVDELLETDIGYRICVPPYAKHDPRVGRMSNAMPGTNENGGCYNHAAGFKAVADCLLGRAEQAWRTFVKVTPDSPENPIENSGAEPFSYTNSYSSVPQVYGKSGYAWRTGTAGWFVQVLVERILGARRSYRGLLIDPCLPAALGEARVTRRFRGATWDIHLINRPGGGKAPRRITIDGRPHEGTTLPLLTAGRFAVEVEM